MQALSAFFVDSHFYLCKYLEVERRENEMKVIIRDNKGFEFQGKRFSVVERYGYRETLLGWFETKAEAVAYRAMREKFSN